MASVRIIRGAQKELIQQELDISEQSGWRATRIDYIEGKFVIWLERVKRRKKRGLFERMRLLVVDQTRKTFGEKWESGLWTNLSCIQKLISG